eukprot:19431-Eustigmatos_ZCMA.PRE.1
MHQVRFMQHGDDTMTGSYLRPRHVGYAATEKTPALDARRPLPIIDQCTIPAQSQAEHANKDKQSQTTYIYIH